MQLHADTCNQEQLHVITCNYVQLLGLTCDYMQLHVGGWGSNREVVYHVRVVRVVLCVLCRVSCVLCRVVRAVHIVRARARVCVCMCVCVCACVCARVCLCVCVLMKQSQRAFNSNRCTQEKINNNKMKRTPIQWCTTRNRKKWKVKNENTVQFGKVGAERMEIVGTYRIYIHVFIHMCIHMCI